MNDIDALLAELRRRTIILRPAARLRVATWSTGQLSKEITQAIRKHRRALAALLAACDVRVCPTPGLHRQYWRHAGQQRYICGMCERLRPWIKAA